jgi:fatty-acyl-CoA synthase
MLTMSITHDHSGTRQALEPALSAGEPRHPADRMARIRGGHRSDSPAISDRLKDIVKSGGEWISSIALENIIMEKTGVKRAAVIAIKDVKWGERPLALVMLEPDHVGKIAEDDIRLHVASFVERGLISKIAIPENVTFVPDLPLTSVGKVDKKKLRAAYRLAA